MVKSTPLNAIANPDNSPPKATAALEAEGLPGAIVTPLGGRTKTGRGVRTVAREDDVDLVEDIGEELEWDLVPTTSVDEVLCNADDGVVCVVEVPPDVVDNGTFLELRVVPGLASFEPEALAPEVMLR